MMAMAPSEELDQTYSRLLLGDSIKESTLMELLNADIRNDQHYLILLSLMHDLCKCTSIFTQGASTAASSENA